MVDGLAAGQLQWPGGHLDAMRGGGVQPRQQVDDLGPIVVVDRVIETIRHGVEVREQRQGMPAVQRADDLTSRRRHWGDDELKPGFGCEPCRCLHGRRQVGDPRRSQIADGHEPSRARLVEREPVVAAEPDREIGELQYGERPLASQRGCNIAVAYIRRALAHRPRLGRRMGRRQQDIYAHNVCTGSSTPATEPFPT